MIEQKAKHKVIYTDEDTHTELKELAKANDRKISDMLRFIIKKYKEQIKDN